MKSNKSRAALFFLVLVGLIVVVRAAGLTDYLDQRRLQEAISRWGIWGPVVYILIFSVAPTLFLPGFPIAVVGGLAFGSIWGTVYASVGSSLGAGAAFLIARYFMRDIVLERLGERWRKLMRGSHGGVGPMSRSHG